MNKADYIARLKRIEGQMRGLQRLIDEDTYCIDVLNQVSAATKALQSVAMGLVDEHIRHCVAGAAAGDDPVEACAFELVEPASGDGDVGCRGGEVDRRAAVGQRLDQGRSTFGEGPSGEVVLAEREQVERDERGRGLLGKQAHP